MIHIIERGSRYILNMKRITETVKELLSTPEARSWNQDLLAKKIGIRRNTLWRWRLGKGKPHEGNLISLAEVFKKDIIWNDQHTEIEFVERELKPGEELPPAVDRPPGATWEPPDLQAAKIPIVGWVADSAKDFFSEDGYPVGHGDDEMNRPYDLKDITAYGLKVTAIQGDSMEPLLRPDDIVICSPAATVRNRDMVVVRFKDEAIMLKEIHFKGDKIRLVSYNPEYEDMEFDKDDLKWYHKVVHIKKK
ncbi:MAG: XRE family transcriptional regulator [Candidatus Neomarinimicrobiota bacterium]